MARQEENKLIITQGILGRPEGLQPSMVIEKTGIIRGRPVIVKRPNQYKR